MSHDGSKKAIFAALTANLGIAIAKLIGFAVTRASSMLAEGIHSLADTGNQLLLLLGSRKASRAPDDQHQFGYARERYFWAFVVAIVLFTLGGVFSVVEGIGKLRNPHEIDQVAWAIGILVVALVLEGLSFRTALAEARPARLGMSLARFVHRTKSPELPVVILEDFAALIGLAVALAAVSASAATGNPAWDAWGTVVIGLLLVVIASILGVEMKSLLIGESAGENERHDIVTAIEGSDHVVRVIHIRTEYLGPDDLLVAAKVHFDESLTIRDLATAIDTVEASVRAAHKSVRQLFIEPDITR